MIITIIEVVIFLAIIIFPVMVPVNKKQQDGANTERAHAPSAYAINQHGELEKLTNA